MNLKINVTEMDISKGFPGSIYHCPIARAIKIELERKKVEFAQVSVTRHMIIVYIRKDGRKHGKYIFLQSRSSEEIKDFITAFDNSRRVKPLSFDLTLVEKKHENQD
jgi:hypothetical protein